MNGRSFKTNVSAKKIVIITAVVLFVMVLVTLAFVARQRGWLGELFGTDQTITQSAELEPTIPDMTLDTADEEHSFYYEPNTEDPLENVKESDSYVRVVRVLTAYGENSSSERITVTKQGEKYRAESASKLIIYDGETLYIKYGSEVLKTQPESSVYYDEFSITSLEEICSMIQDTENYSAELEISENGREINVTIQELSDEAISMVFRISLENGITASERTYLNDVMYRSVVTESFEISVDDNIQNDTFKIPD